MITITELEFVLFIGLVVMTYLYFKQRAEIVSFKTQTMNIFHQVAIGKLKIKETEDGFEMEVTNASK
jgi:hypothetical protein